jgi:hypothetical protein
VSPVLAIFPDLEPAFGHGIEPGQLVVAELAVDADRLAFRGRGVPERCDYRG